MSTLNIKEVEKIGWEINAAKHAAVETPFTKEPNDDAINASGQFQLHIPYTDTDAFMVGIFYQGHGTKDPMTSTTQDHSNLSLLFGPIHETKYVNRRGQLSWSTVNQGQSGIGIGEITFNERDGIDEQSIDTVNIHKRLSFGVRTYISSQAFIGISPFFEYGTSSGTYSNGDDLNRLHIHYGLSVNIGKSFRSTNTGDIPPNSTLHDIELIATDLHALFLSLQMNKGIVNPQEDLEGYLNPNSTSSGVNTQSEFANFNFILSLAGTFGTNDAALKSNNLFLHALIKSGLGVLTLANSDHTASKKLGSSQLANGMHLLGYRLFIGTPKKRDYISDKSIANREIALSSIFFLAGLFASQVSDSVGPGIVQQIAVKPLKLSKANTAYLVGMDNDSRFAYTQHTSYKMFFTDISAAYGDDNGNAIFASAGLTADHKLFKPFAGLTHAIKFDISDTTQSIMGTAGLQLNIGKLSVMGKYIGNPAEDNSDHSLIGGVGFNL